VHVTNRPLILICDDDAMMRELIATTLRHEEFDVLVAASGPDAVALASQHRPDLVLMDFVMPGPFGGLETLGELADRNIAPVAMLTALDDDRDRDRAARRGAIAFLNKAESMEGLGDRVRKVLADCARRDNARS
jgi:DNA-binding response OmpR family regulator